MWDWSGKLDVSLSFNEWNILQNAGRASHEAAVVQVEKEDENLRVEKDKWFESDFDRMVKKYKLIMFKFAFATETRINLASFMCI